MLQAKPTKDSQKELDRPETIEEEVDEKPRSKPWLIYLQSLRIPICCHNHSKTVGVMHRMITRERQDERSGSRRAPSQPAIKNPNCNHNSSSVFYQATFSHIKYGKKKVKPEITNLLFKDPKSDEEE